jgi:hypothetical protein
MRKYYLERSKHEYINSTGLAPLQANAHWLTKLLFWTYSVFLVGLFFFPTAPDHYKFYYFAVLPLAVVRIPAGLSQLRNNLLFRLLVLYVVYMVLSATWSDPFSFPGLLQSIMAGLYVLVFCVITVVLYIDYPEQFALLLQITCVIAGLAAIIAMGVWYRDHPFPQARLPGIGRLYTEVRSACAYGFFVVLTADYVLRTRRTSARLGFALLVFIVLGFVLLTQSRTGLLAVGVGLLVLTLAEHTQKAATGLLLLAAGSGLLLLSYPELLEGLRRSEPYRPAIWSAVVNYALQAPFFGHGYLVDTSVYVNSTKFIVAHSSYLATLRDGGCIGLCLLLSLLGYAGWSAFRLARESGNYVLLALLLYGMICMAPDGDRLLTRPREQWLFLWLPLALIMAQPGSHSERSRYTRPLM